MADVGRSTAAHAEGDVDTHAMLARLENWGAWQRSLPADGPGMYPPSPMFKDVVDRYRETFAPSPYDADDAKVVEKLAADELSIRHVLCLNLRFVLRISSRKAAGIMSRQGHPCTHTTYRVWVESAVNKLSIVELNRAPNELNYE